MSNDSQEFGSFGRRHRTEWPKLDNDLMEVIVRSHQLLETLEPPHAFILPDLPKYRKWTIRPYTVEYPAMEQEKNWNDGKLLLGLYYRSRFQSTIYNLFVMLVELGYLDYEAMKLPIRMGHTTMDNWNVSKRLECFQGTLDSEEMSYDIFAWPWSANHQSEGLHWLAVMIVRGYVLSDLEPLFKKIEDSAILGKFDHEKWEHDKRRGILHHATVSVGNINQINWDPSSNIGISSYIDPGFWLPYQGTEDPKASMASGLEEFNRIERAFKTYFQVSDADLMTEDMEYAFYNNVGRLDREIYGKGGPCGPRRRKLGYKNTTDCKKRKFEEVDSLETADSDGNNGGAQPERSGMRWSSRSRKLLSLKRLE